MPSTRPQATTANSRLMEFRSRDPVSFDIEDYLRRPNVPLEEERDEILYHDATLARLHYHDYCMKRSSDAVCNKITKLVKEV
jgi:hypothetical protein